MVPTMATASSRKPDEAVSTLGSDHVVIVYECLKPMNLLTGLDIQTS